MSRQLVSVVEKSVGEHGSFELTWGSWQIEVETVHSWTGASVSVPMPTPSAEIETWRYENMQERADFIAAIVAIREQQAKGERP